MFVQFWDWLLKVFNLPRNNSRKVIFIFAIFRFVKQFFVVVDVIISANEELDKKKELVLLECGWSWFFPISWFCYYKKFLPFYCSSYYLFSQDSLALWVLISPAFLFLLPKVKLHDKSIFHHCFKSISRHYCNDFKVTETFNWKLNCQSFESWYKICKGL